MKLGEFAKTVTLVAVLSSVVNAGLAFVGWQVSQPPATFSPYDYTMVVGLTILGVLAAAVVYYAMRRVYQRAPITAINRRFILLSVVLALSSRAGALGILVALAGVLLARGTALAWLNRGLA